MPAIVDHDQRRSEIAEIAASLVAEGGVDAATVRAIARNGGFSTKVVSHYFADKRALMTLTYEHSAKMAREATSASQLGSAPSVEKFVRALLPTTELKRRSWRVWIAFWGLAIGDQELADRQNNRVRDTQNRIRQVMKDDPRFALLSATLRRRHARSILAAVHGVAIQATFDPKRWPQARQFQVVEMALRAADGDTPLDRSYDAGVPGRGVVARGA